MIRKFEFEAKTQFILRIWKVKIRKTQKKGLMTFRRFACISYFNCEHFLFVFIVKKMFGSFIKRVCRCSKNKNRNLFEANFCNFDHP